VCSCEETSLLPILLIFFIVSSLWSALSFVLLRWGPPPLLNVTTALLYPMTLFGFVAPVRRDWWPLLAPPEPFSPALAAAVALLSAAIAAFLLASTGCCGLSPGRAPSSRFGLLAAKQGAVSSSVGTSPPVGPDEADNDASNASTSLGVPPFVRSSVSYPATRPSHERTEHPAFILRPNASSSAADMQHSPTHGAPRVSAAAAVPAAAKGRSDAGAARAFDEQRLGLRDGTSAPSRRQPVALAPAGATAFPATNGSVFEWQ
jgi:hypothetical protein